MWWDSSLSLLLATLIFGCPGSILVAASLIYIYREEKITVMLSLLLLGLTLYAVCNSLSIAFVGTLPNLAFWTGTVLISDLVVGAIVVILLRIIVPPTKRVRSVH
jgi:hypothetical protein